MHNDEAFSDGKLNKNLSEINACQKNIENIAQQYNDKNCVLLWHKKLGHSNNNLMKEQPNLANDIQTGTYKHKEICETYIK